MKKGVIVTHAIPSWVNSTVSSGTRCAMSAGLNGQCRNAMFAQW
jgi:hypothetical protein